MVTVPPSGTGQLVSIASPRVYTPAEPSAIAPSVHAAPPSVIGRQPPLRTGGSGGYNGSTERRSLPLTLEAGLIEPGDADEDREGGSA